MKRSPTRARAAWFASRRWLPLVASLACSLAAGCGDGEGSAPAPLTPGAAPEAAETATAPPAEPKPEERVGSLSLALRTQEGSELDAFNYAITGPDFAKSGSIDVSSSTTVVAIIDGIPAGSGYSMTLTGASTTADLECSGSAMFAITAGATTSVPISIACHALTAAAPSDATPAPLPPLATAALSLALLAIGAAAATNRRDRRSLRA